MICQWSLRRRFDGDENQEFGLGHVNFDRPVEQPSEIRNKVYVWKIEKVVF